MRHVIRYGKHNVSFYRTHPTRGLLAGLVNIDVFGDNFLPAYTDGDNREVVATDTMKNFVYAMALEYPGASHEGFAAFLGRRLLTTYPQMQSLRLFVEEIPFEKHSPRLLSPLDDDYGTVELEIERDGLRTLRCGRRNLRLVKLTGSAFKDFARDAYTTLPERSDRPLFIHLDVHWRYGRMEDGISDGPARVASGQTKGPTSLRSGRLRAHYALRRIVRAQVRRVKRGARDGVSSPQRGASPCPGTGANRSRRTRRGSGGCGGATSESSRC